MNFKNVNLLGLNSYASHRVTEKNYLLDCNNIVADQLGVIGTRRGQEFLGGAFTLIKKIFSGINELFVQADDSLYYDNAGSFTEVTFPDTTSFNPLPGTLVNTDSQNKSLFFNGERISDDTGSPVDRKIKKLTSPSASVVNAGLEAPINVRIEIDETGTTFAINDSVRVRAFYQYTDENGYLITSEVSESAVGFNDTAATCGFILKFEIPIQYNTNLVDVYYAVSNTVNNFTPDDNLFWGDETIVASQVSINTANFSFYNFNNIIPRNSILTPVDLYTNSGQEGILQNNNPPISAEDIETYSNHTFLSNIKDKWRRYFSISVLPVGVTCFTYDGISYRRSTIAQTEEMPYTFIGDDIVSASYNFAQLFNSTQTRYTAKIIGTNLNDMGDDIGWVNSSASLDNSTSPTFACVDNNGNAYFMREPEQRLTRYNIISESFTELAETPFAISGNSLVYHAASDSVYSIAGLNEDAAFSQAPVLKYNIRENSWEELASMPLGPSGNPVSRCATVIYQDDDVYVFFGVSSLAGPDQNYYFHYRISTNSFLTGGTIPTPSSYGRVDAGAAVVGSNIYIFGGYIQNTASNSDNLFRFTPLTSSFSTLANMPYATSAFGITTVGSVIYVINGLGAPDLDTVFTYDPVSVSYGTITNTNQSSRSVAAVTYNSTIYKIGGSTNGASPAVTYIESYRVGGIGLIIEDRYLSDEAPPGTSSIYVVNKNIPGSSSPVFQYSQPASILFSKQGQPEAVPFFNSFNVGSASSPIVRIAALRSSLIILKSDGLYQLNGISPETFGLQQLDPTCQIIAAQSLAKLDNEIYCLTSEGVSCINESGARIISYPIKDLIDAQLYSVPEADWNTAITATAYDLDYKYVLTIGDKTFTYNYITEQWTIWHAGNENIKSWTVFENKLYYADTTRVLKERKSFTSSDFQDENGDGIDAFMQFNNLEFSPGKQLLIQDMQILQRNISNLTVGIEFENDFNTPASFNKVLSTYVSRVMPPNASRQAFYFRPKFTWNTEIAATPGTFATSSFEGLDIGFKELDSNLR